ncbi:MAG TPA: neutral zinc metallopeptidase [Solirubrobacteraceae bacterium]|nr:neutral zinc metallopeptidase [Solirubrobacteraceae bacterium]
MIPRRLLPLVLALLALGSGCGADEVRERAEQVREDVEERIRETREEFEERRERYGRRIREVLGDLEKVFEQPERTLPRVRSRGRNEPQTIDAFLTDLLADVDRYWTRTFATGGLPEPRVGYDWVPPGGLRLTACGATAGDDAAFYCPADDTIYIGQQFAADLYNGVLRGLPGEAAGYGRAVGDFAVAYVVAHEYAHNLQQELGIFDNRVGSQAKPFELQADCMAGTWAHSVFAAGDLEPDDLEEASNAALAVGDFDVGNAQHHGTPEERRDALLAGFESGDPSVCRRFVPEV